MNLFFSTGSLIPAAVRPRLKLICACSCSFGIYPHICSAMILREYCIEVAPEVAYPEVENPIKVFAFAPKQITVCWKVEIVFPVFVGVATILSAAPLSISPHVIVTEGRVEDVVAARDTAMYTLTRYIALTTGPPLANKVVAAMFAPWVSRVVVPCSNAMPPFTVAVAW